MKYTKKEKRAIYTKVLSTLQGEHLFGICFNLTRISKCQLYDEPSLTLLFPEIFSQRPSDITVGSYWFPVDYGGNLNRIKIIETALKKVT